MVSMFRLFPFLTALLVGALLPYGASAQAPPVPPVFQDLYTSLNTDLTDFNAMLNVANGSRYEGVSAANLTNANANVGPQLLKSTNSSGVQLQLQEIKAMGAKAVMLQIGFPMLYEPFLASQGQSYDQFVAYYQQVAAAVRAAGLKLIIENNTLLTTDVQAGWDVAPFYATLDWTQYQQARAQTALTVARLMQPDYLIVVEEPNTEAFTSGQSLANTPDGSAALLGQILASVGQSGVPGMLVGAGTCTGQQNFLSFIQAYAAMPVDFIDMHIYPINRNLFSNALRIAAIAAAAGKPVAVSENWLWKVRDDELNVMTPEQVRARNPFDFWAPVDAYFLQTMENLAQSTQMLFMAPMGTASFAAYLPYDASTMNLSPGAILNQQSAQASRNMHAAIYTSTATSYHDMLVWPADTVPPTVPTDLNGQSANPATAYLIWTASTDDVGVAGYYVLRDGSIIGTTADLYYQDSGLTESATYTYTVEAFDLAGNVSAPSLRANVTASDVTPPTPPGNVTATALSCERVILTWSPSQDVTGVNYYSVLSGLSPGALVEEGRALGTSGSYTSYPLTNGTTYYYAVRAVDKFGNNSDLSSIVKITTPMPPSPPAGLSATPGSATRIGLAWSASASGGLPVQYYHVFRGTSPSGLTEVAVVSQTSYTDTSVAAATTYYYGVQAADTGLDLSAMSVVVMAKTPSLPSAPPNLAATPGSTTSVGLTWSAAAGGGLPIANYRVYRGSSPATLVQLAIVVQTSYTDSTVSAGATYYYAVVAVDTGSDLSPMSAAVMAVVPVAPGAPANLAATPVSTTTISLTWSAAASGGLPIQYYRVFRGRSPSSLSQVATVTQVAYTDTEGSPATMYYYSVQALDTGGDVSAMSATVSATTLAALGAPANLTARAVSKARINLAWTQPSSSLPLSSYTIYRGSSAGSLAAYKTIGPAKPAYTDNQVSARTTYYYAVQAKDTGGNLSPRSAVVSVTTPR